MAAVNDPTTPPSPAATVIPSNDENKPVTPKPTNRRPANADSSVGANSNAYDNMGVDDGLLDPDSNSGNPATPRPAGPDATEPGDVEVPATPGGREQPRGQPRPGPRPDNPFKPVDPPYVDPAINNGLNYTTKKNIAQGMMDIALLTANASQLRYVMRSPYWDIYHRANIVLISISIALQIIAGVLLIFISRYDFKRKESHNLAQILNDIVVVFIFIITVVNIFIAAFGVDDERTTFLRWKESIGNSNVEPLFLPMGSSTNSSQLRP